MELFAIVFREKSTHKTIIKLFVMEFKQLYIQWQSSKLSRALK